MPAYAPRRKPQPTQAERHPFMNWVGGLLAASDATCIRHNDTFDFVLDDAATTMAIGVETGGICVLGVTADDAAAISSISWKSAALVRRHKNRDWVALAIKDVRIKGSEESNPTPVRLWIPVAASVMDSFGITKPTVLRIREIEVEGGLPTVPDQPPLMEMPLSMKGKW
jgi:hypothetical protein